jgi:hypothetical protein
MDITIKGIPEGVSEAQVKEWVAILIERFENQKVNQIQAVKDAVVTAQTGIDGFRSSNGLALKFKKEEAVSEPN